MNLKLAVFGLSFAGIFCSTSAYADICQEYMRLAAESDANATRDVGTGAQLLRQAAQTYRNAYNTNCTGSRGGSIGGSYGSAGRAAGMNQIMNGLAGMAAVLEQKRQREEAEAHEAAMQTELQRIRQETEDAQSKAQAERLQIQKEAEDAQRKVQAGQAAAIAKAEDDRKRQSLRDPFKFSGSGGSGGCSGYQGNPNPFNRPGDPDTPNEPGVSYYERDNPCSPPLNKPVTRGNEPDPVAVPGPWVKSREAPPVDPPKTENPFARAASNMERAPGLYTKDECEVAFAYAKGVVAYWRGGPYDQKAICEYVPDQKQTLDLQYNPTGVNEQEQAVKALTQ